MIEGIPYIPHFVTTCQDSGLVVEQDGPEIWNTWCEEADGCYGCNGKSRFVCSVDPRGFKHYKTHDSMRIIPNETPQRLWLNEEEIAGVLEQYKGSEEQYFWRAQIWCDLDAIVIYTWEDPEDDKS